VNKSKLQIISILYSLLSKTVAEDKSECGGGIEDVEDESLVADVAWLVAETAAWRPTMQGARQHQKEGNVSKEQVYHTPHHTLKYHEQPDKSCLTAILIKPMNAGYIFTSNFQSQTNYCK
jgi:hypothetical protein